MRSAWPLLTILAALALTSAIAQANDEQGHPEGYSDLKKIEKPLEPTAEEIDKKAVAVVGFGQLELESAACQPEPFGTT
jgi:hypothetical protein